MYTHCVSQRYLLLPISLISPLIQKVEIILLIKDKKISIKYEFSIIY